MTLQDGTESVRSLRPIHLQLVQGRREAEVEEAEAAAEAAAQAAAENARRLDSSRPSNLKRELITELRTKSFDEMRRMAASLGDEAYELLHNPLISYDRATFREELAELLVNSSDSDTNERSLLYSLMESAAESECARGEDEDSSQ